MKKILFSIMLVVMTSTAHAKYVSGLKLGSVYIKLGQTKEATIDSVYKYFDVTNQSPNLWLLRYKDSPTKQETFTIIFNNNRVEKISINYLNNETTAIEAINIFYSTLKERFDLPPSDVVYNQNNIGVKIKGVSIELYTKNTSGVYSTEIVCTKDNAMLTLGTVAADISVPYLNYEIKAIPKKNN